MSELMTPDEMMEARTTASSVKFVQEGPKVTCENAGLHTVEVEVTPRDWDVTDPEARYQAATEELGPLTTEHKTCFQWWIDPDRNAAALAVYCPWERERVGVAR